MEASELTNLTEVAELTVAEMVRRSTHCRCCCCLC